MYKAILFDLDGTLLDTTRGVLSAVKRTIRDNSFDMPNETILNKFVGPPMQVSMAKYFNLDNEIALEVANQFRKNYKDYSLFEADLYPDVIKMLENLKKNGYKIAIATNKSHQNAVDIIEHFGIAKYCDFYMGSDLEGKLKKADIVRICMEKINATTDNTVLIGDSVYDAIGAQQACIDFIGVTYGFGFKNAQDFQNINFVNYFNSVPDLAEYLLSKNEVIS